MNLVEAPGVEEIDQELQLRSLADFIPAVSPKYMAPRHLAPLIHRIEMAAEGIPQRVCCSAPPRHSKTETVLHVPAFVLRRNPALTLSYSTYADQLSQSKSRRARRLVEERLGIETTGSVNEWRTEEGGGLLAGGVGGPLTGHGVDLGFVDDPYKNRVQAESAAYRSMLSDWVHDVLISRIEPNGSIFIFATRWHPDDIIGEMIGEGFEFINLPALGSDKDGVRVADEDGRALWPERWTTEMMRARLEEVGPYTAASLYQGQPRPRGSTVFGPPSTYQSLPNVYRTAGGTDSAYSVKKTADRSAAVVMHARDGNFYISYAKAMRVPAPAFKAFCRSIHDANPAMTWRWYAATSELGAGQFMADDEDGSGIPLNCLIATADKFVRAIPFAAAWNAGKVFVDANMGAVLLEEFLAEMASFTGVADKRDDLVDAAVAAFDELQGGSDTGPIAKRRPRAEPLSGM